MALKRLRQRLFYVNFKQKTLNYQFHIQTPTPALEHSLRFYTSLGFRVVSQSDPCVVTDGKALIQINAERTARAGIRVYSEDLGDALEALKSNFTVREIPTGHLLADPSGTWIYLDKDPLGVDFTPEEASFSTLGNFMGMSLEVVNIEKSIILWETLGLKKAMGDVSQGWVAYAHESGFGVSLMVPNACPHMFFNPSLTFFNSGNNVEVIGRIRHAGIPITEEITQFNKDGIVDNVIVRDPGGLGFFVFND